MIINSDESLAYFPDNKPFRFKTHLAKTLSLPGKWVVALTEIDLLEKIQLSSLYVNCDICQSTIVDGEWTNVLRLINTGVKRQFTNSFNWLYYLSVVKSEIREIEISIKQDSGVYATVLNRPVRVTLHFMNLEK
ncbi:MAG: hypothetical protein AB2598_20635 [Candidatus Thiodiazotropha sp.]